VKIQVEIFWVVTPCTVMGYAASVFRMNMGAVWPSETLASWYITTSFHNSEERDFDHHFTSPWRWRQQRPPKRWCPSASYTVSQPRRPQLGSSSLQILSSAFIP